MTRANNTLPSEAPAYSPRLERLVTGAAGLLAEMHLDTVLQRAADLAAEVIGAKYAAVGMLAADGRTLEAFITSGLTAEERQRIGALPQGHGILGLVIHKAESVRLRSIGSHPESHGFPPNHPPMESFLGVPILGKRGVLGDLYLTEKIGATEFSKEDERIAQLLAASAAVAIENARLHEQSARLLEEVQQLHRSRERFFAMVNHELRNSLAAVYGWSEMLVRRKEPGSVPRAAFEVLDSAEQAISLINDLLDLSRLDEDRLKPVLKDVDCAGVLRQALSRLTPAADSKQVRLLTDLSSSTPICRTDPHRVEQILVNLLTNAVRHTPAGTSVRSHLTRRGDEVIFRIEDEGPGVGPDDVEAVFDIYKTDAGEEGKGTGLGLPLSRRLARLLGGELRAEAPPSGGGVFVLSLPVGYDVRVSS
ncbi:MAG TPA: GAF domain-containing sensor histidine kinase [Gemmatimonadales bacterium]|nr:GAF domain-containing sensor histidine kinase [Gemmatimonadales bacterium]